MYVRALIGCVLLCGLAVSSAADEPKETKLKPTLILSGSHSAIRKEKFVLVTAQGGWEKLWKEHRGDEKAQRFTESEQELDIDFDTHYVVAVFFGGGYDKGGVTSRQRGNTVLLGCEGETYQTEGRVPGQPAPVDKRTDFEKAKKEAEAAYAFVVLPKPVKTVVIEKNVRRELGDPPIWKERMRFPAPKDNK